MIVCIIKSVLIIILFFFPCNTLGSNEYKNSFFVAWTKNIENMENNVKYIKNNPISFIKIKEYDRNIELRKAVERIDITTVESLLNEGADPDIKNSQGYSAFDIVPLVYANTVTKDNKSNQQSIKNLKQIHTMLFEKSKNEVLATYKQTNDTQFFRALWGRLTGQEQKPFKKSLMQAIKDFDMYSAAACLIQGEDPNKAYPSTFFYFKLSENDSFPNSLDEKNIIEKVNDSCLLMEKSVSNIWTERADCGFGETTSNWRTPLWYAIQTRKRIFVEKDKSNTKNYIIPMLDTLIESNYIKDDIILKMLFMYGAHEIIEAKYKIKDHPYYYQRVIRVPVYRTILDSVLSDIFSYTYIPDDVDVVGKAYGAFTENFNYYEKIKNLLNKRITFLESLGCIQVNKDSLNEMRDKIYKNLLPLSCDKQIALNKFKKIIHEHEEKSLNIIKILRFRCLDESNTHDVIRDISLKKEIDNDELASAIWKAIFNKDQNTLEQLYLYVREKESIYNAGYFVGDLLSEGEDSYNLPYSLSLPKVIILYSPDLIPFLSRIKGTNLKHLLDWCDYEIPTIVSHTLKVTKNDKEIIYAICNKDTKYKRIRYMVDLLVGTSPIERKKEKELITLLLMIHKKKNNCLSLLPKQVLRYIFKNFLCVPISEYLIKQNYEALKKARKVCINLIRKDSNSEHISLVKKTEKFLEDLQQKYK